MPSDIPDCITCGACCFGARETYIALLPEDGGRAIPAEATFAVGKVRFLRMCGGHCAQLARSPLGEAVCGIYPERPTACRAFRAGSFECLMARKHNGRVAEAFRAAPEMPGTLPPENLPGAPAEVA
ncbi:YkgJ family cysteine cluster protein [Pseudoroseicyclus tamaricis]|uniref:YkgJ family cysteine cluster protein n=1 Tax=Pseudoroseicyclus tamaricis TaxID=2705421 RepID=A0A6B2JP45_9RHOB|nr:YkgJ family cysteine cluster protein [Pseudoroseicyclus tamaricis]NDV00467.1 YkgJ family cysteine cluster protein [Pseudoroseicyclus tamaricis]